MGIRKIFGMALLAAGSLAISTPVLAQSSTQPPPTIADQADINASNAGRTGDLFPGTVQRDQSFERTNPDEEYKKAVDAMANDDPATARKSLLRVIRSARKHAPSYYLLGLAEIDLDKKKEARKHLEKAIKYDPDFVYARLELVRLYATDGNLDKAKQQLPWLDKRIQSCANTCILANDLEHSREVISAAISNESLSVTQ